MPSPITLARLYALFTGHNWPMDKLIYKEKFDKFCALVDKLTIDEQNFILTLAEDFIYMPFDKYPYLVEDCFNKIDISKYNNLNTIYVVSLKDPKDTKTSKSGDSLLYSFTHQYAPVYFGIEPDKVILLPKINSLIPKRRGREPSLFIFADDFVGSGDTGFAALNNFSNNIKIQGDSCILLTLVSMETGFNRLKHYVDDYVTSIIAKKGIEGSSKISNKPEAYEIMSKIESKLNNDPNMKFGYMQSESLVSLIRTPDNTFPVFWMGKELAGGVWPAPFLRAE